jgi:hypothetical protein
MRQTYGIAALGLFWTLCVTACSVTQQARPQLAGDQCALIQPNVCAQLAPGPAGGAALRYVAPDVQWRDYTQVMVSPVTTWGGEAPKIPPADAQALADYLHNAFVKAFATKFRVVDAPGPGVLQILIGVTDAEAATPVLRTVSMAVPQARVLATLKYVATSTYPFIGAAQGELEARDSMSGRVLAAAIDRRVGGGAVTTAAQWQWGDAENAMNTWAQTSVNRLASLQSGR